MWKKSSLFEKSGFFITRHLACKCIFLRPDPLSADFLVAIEPIFIWFGLWNASFMKNLSFYSSFCNFRPEFRPIFLRYSHSLYKTHTADLPVSSLPIGMSHTTLPEPPCTPLIRSGLHFISGKPIANSQSRRSQQRIRWGYLWVPNKIETPIWRKQAPEKWSNFDW